jgi:hypothetical protein
LLVNRPIARRVRAWWPALGRHGVPDRGSAGFVAGTAATKVECELFRLFAGVRVDHELPQRHPAVVAGVGALGLVVVVLGRWV